MDWVAFWTSLAAFDAWFAAIGALGTLLAAILQLSEARDDRQTDDYRKLTPFLSAEFVPASDVPSGNEPIVTIYADGNGNGYMVLAKIVQTNSSTGRNSWLPGQKVIRYLRAGASDRIPFAQRVVPPFAGYLELTFSDIFGIQHAARESVNAASGQVAVTDAISWTCGADCRAHRVREAPPHGLLAQLARRLRLY